MIRAANKTIISRKKYTAKFDICILPLKRISNKKNLRTPEVRRIKGHCSEFFSVTGKGL